MRLGCGWIGAGRKAAFWPVGSQDLKIDLSRMKFESKDDAIIGIADHGGWAALVTVTGDGTVVDRRRIELVDPGLPPLPHHHEAQRLPLDQALNLVERVRGSAERHAALGLATMARTVSVPIRGVALRVLQTLPLTTAERLRDYRSQNVADWVMYREALARAAESRGWTVHWYDAKTVLEAARTSLHPNSLDAHFDRAKKSLGAPWGKDQKVAMAAALMAAAALD